LPLIDAETQIIDTSPDQLIGCANDLPIGGEQQILDSLFPEGISGDGVVNRDNNDIWTYDGSIWTNVGPTPGLQLVVVSVLPPWSEIVIVLGLIKAKISIESLKYALEITTEVGVVAVKTKATVKTLIIVQIPPISINLEALAPVFESNAKLFGKVADVIYYDGTGIVPQQLATQWQANMMLLYSQGSNWLWFDVVRGNKAWAPNTSTETDISLGDSPSSVNFNENNITVQGDLVNNSTKTYRAYAFKGRLGPVSNMAGSTPAVIYESDAFNIISYEGTGTTATIGHGLGATPALLIIKRENSSGVVGGSFIGANYYTLTSSSSARFFSANHIKGFTNDTINIGSDFSVNSAGISYTCYAFKQKENQCKIGIYYGDGTAGGQSINCEFGIGVVLVKNLTNSGAWVLLNEQDQSQGFATPTWSNSTDFTNTEKIYEFADGNFTVYGTSASVNTVFQLNRLGNEYMYMALAVGFYQKLNCPSVNIEFQDYPPVIYSGVSIQAVTAIVSMLAQAPPYAGKRATIAAVRRKNIELQAYEPVINTGVNISPPMITFRLKTLAIPYVGEVAQDGRTYVAIVEGLDGSPLEKSVCGCIYALIKDLKVAGLWSKFLTIVPTCAAKTYIGALVPLAGRFPNTQSLTPSSINYNRRTGYKAILFGSSFFTGLRNNEVPVTDSHLAVYVNELNSGAGFDLIGDGFTNNSLGISRPTSGSGFSTRNQDSTTATSVAPHWSQPSIVGMTRQSSSDYTLRLADTNRSIASPIVDQSTNTSSRNINMFNFAQGTGDFRVPFYSIGLGLDLAVLEAIVETFLDRLRLIGLPDARILPPVVNLQIEASVPLTVGRPKTQIVTNSIDLILASSPPRIAGGYSATVESTNQDLQGKNPRLAGVLRTPVLPGLIQFSVSSTAPTIATGTAPVVPSKTYSITAAAPSIIEARTGNLNLTLLVEDDLLNLGS
jgi:hypothetical protein